MPVNLNYRAVMHQLARLADAPNPPHVRVDAAIALVNELSPLNPRHKLVLEALKPIDPFTIARRKLRDLYDNVSSISASPPASSGGRCLVETEGGSPADEEPNEEDDDPL